MVTVIVAVIATVTVADTETASTLIHLPTPFA
jgi:hypothetical protein